MPLVGGSGYPAAAGLLRILAPIVAVAAINNAAAQAVIADGSVLRLLRLSIICLTANAALCFTLIPRLGAPGAGIASVITESLGMVVVFVMARRIRPRDDPVDSDPDRVGATARPA
jgi:O-antigen/teichoic acid export membrane protein